MIAPLPLDDRRWRVYKGGYRTEYNASGPLRKLLELGPTSELWDSLWNELHHQGDVDAASYAAVPWLLEYLRKSSRLDWNALSLIVVIELERPRNPDVPPELQDAYFDALDQLPAVIGAHPDREWDDIVVRAATACIAIARGQRWFAKACFELDRDTAARWFSEEFGWEFNDV